MKRCRSALCYLVLSSSLVAALLMVSSSPAQAEEPTLAELQAQRDADLRKIRSVYDKRALQRVPKNPDGTLKVDSPEYKDLLKNYKQATAATRLKYAQQDPRGEMIDDILSRHPDIQNTGSKPKDVYADVDLAGKSPDATKQLAGELRAKGHDVRAVTTPDGEVIKYVDTTTDTTIWNPETDGIRKAKVADHDAWTTAGGQKGTGNIDRPSDPRGYVIDNEGKFIHSDNPTNYVDPDGNFRMYDEDLKTFAKSAHKAGTHVGLDETNPGFYDQVDQLRNYHDPVEAGIANLGDTPDVQAKKVEEWKPRARNEMNKAKAQAEVRGQRIDDLRNQLADQVDSTLKNTPDELKGFNDGMDQRIRDRVDETRTSRETQAAENKRMADEQGPRQTASGEPPESKMATDVGDGPRSKRPDVIHLEDNSVGQAGDGPGSKPADVDGAGGRIADVDGPRQTAVGEPPKSNMAADVGDGPRPRPADVDGIGGRVPDVDGPRATTHGGGLKSKAVDAFGKGMVGVDIFNAGQNVLDVIEGKKDAGDAVIETADALTGGVYGTGKILHEKGSDFLEARDRSADDAAHVVETGLALRQAGVSSKDVRDIMKTMSDGDDTLLQNKLNELKQKGVTVDLPEPPKRQESTWSDMVKGAVTGRWVVDGVEADDNYLDRTVDTVNGIVDQTSRAGKFAVQTGKNVAEIAGGLTEEGVVDELVDQQRKNLSSENYNDWADKRESDRIREDREKEFTDLRHRLRDKLVERGADPREADAAIDALDNNDNSLLKDLRKRLAAEEKNQSPNESDFADAADFSDAGDFSDPWAGGGGAKTASPAVHTENVPGFDPNYFARKSSGRGQSQDRTSSAQPRAKRTVYHVIYQCTICNKIHDGGVYNTRQQAATYAQRFQGTKYRAKIVPRSVSK